MKKILGSIALALTLAAGGAAWAEEAALFKDLIPGKPVSVQELEQQLGRGVNDRGSVVTSSSSSETSSQLNQNVQSQTSSSFTSSVSASGSRPASGAASITSGGRVGGQSRLLPGGGAGSTTRDFRSPSGNTLRSPSVRSTQRIGSRF